MLRDNICLILNNLFLNHFENFVKQSDNIIYILKEFYCEKYFLYIITL